ncbi:peptidyl-tRNA hydrolase ICT1, mitochondrial [Schistocerca gregaria]|uniref:peptidyl-tRNA hydrolase ICT1, mitochondrial n=1 Tax=Schistocerca gregaria TaxID=7010 RepID=UPI00211DE665|nr:peptidyl-tRNA hydrolase ICT1, mitochondrial [Schistocerca gregaria]
MLSTFCGRNATRVLASGLLFGSIAELSTYRSKIALDTLYPTSRLTVTTPKKMPEDNVFSGYIPIEKLDITYSRSSGPGGQNVNMVNTKVDLRFHIETADWINDDIKTRLFKEHRTKINKEGYLVIRSDKTRSQQLNLADAMERLRSMIRELIEPKEEISEETLEKHRRRKEKSVRERLFEKRHRSQVKLDRQAPAVDF